MHTFITILKRFVIVVLKRLLLCVLDGVFCRFKNKRGDSMFVDLDRDGTVEGLQYLLKRADDDKNTQGILILSCDASGFTPEKVDEILIQCKKPVFGGIFSQVLYNKEKLEKGTIVAGIRQPVNTTIVKGISDISFNLDATMESAFEWQYLQNKTMFIFLDGLSQNISALIDSMFNCWGLLPNYIGGGAGSLNERKPCIFTGKGLLEDAAVFALTDIKSGIGVAHGWRPVVGPFKVTEADCNTLISLNWRSAFDVYRETVEKISGKSFDNSDFIQLAKEFPFGIAKMSDEMVVRDPIALDGSKLICVGEVPLNSFVYILKGDKDSLIEGAAKARQLAEESYRKTANSEETKPITTFF